MMIVIVLKRLRATIKHRVEANVGPHMFLKEKNVYCLPYIYIPVFLDVACERSVGQLDHLYMFSAFFLYGPSCMME